MRNNRVKTAVLPVAGMGTRFLPVTKAGPKEMLPLVDKPIIQYVVEEALAAGIRQFVFVTSLSKRAIEDYFDSNFELESLLHERGKWEALAKVKNILPADASVVYVRQPNPLGLGDAVLRTRQVIGDQPFAVLLPDDIIDCGEKTCLSSMVDLYEETGASVLAVEKIDSKDSEKYGIVSLAEARQLPYQVSSIVEKPTPKDAPSNLAVTGRYILTPRIFEFLAKTHRGVGGEIQLTDGIAALLDVEPIVAFPFNGRRYDCGSPMGFMEATLAYALKRDELREPLLVYMQKLLEAPR